MHYSTPAQLKQKCKIEVSDKKEPGKGKKFLLWSLNHFGD